MQRATCNVQRCTHKIRRATQGRVLDAAPRDFWCPLGPIFEICWLPAGVSREPVWRQSCTLDVLFPSVFSTWIFDVFFNRFTRFWLRFGHRIFICFEAYVVGNVLLSILFRGHAFCNFFTYFLIDSRFSELSGTRILPQKDSCLRITPFLKIPISYGNIFRNSLLYASSPFRFPLIFIIFCN